MYITPIRFSAKRFTMLLKKGPDKKQKSQNHLHIDLTQSQEYKITTEDSS